MRQKDELISRAAAIDALMAWEEDSFWDDECLKHRGEPFWVAPSDVIEQLPSAQPEPSQVARDIATIIENEKDMRVIASAQPEQHWIPCSERLPKKERSTYWVCTDAETQHECRWTNNRFGMTELDEWGWSIFDTPQYTKVIAWMPLPEPWRGEEHE